MTLEPATWIALGLIAALAVYVIMLCWVDGCPERSGDDQ